MPVVVGLMFVLPVAAIIYKSNLITTKKKVRVLLNLSLVLLSMLFIAFCWLVKEEPFDFEEYYSPAFMLLRGDYILNSLVVIVFTPFMWMILIHFLRMLLRSLRVKKNGVIRRSQDYIYYRDDLDQVSPAIVIFVSQLEPDVRKCVASTLLKLKLSGFIKEESGAYRCTKKEQSGLSESERMVLGLVMYHEFDRNRYQEAVAQEALQGKYLTKSQGGMAVRIMKMLAAVCGSVLLLVFSVWFDAYTFENYQVYPADDGNTYFWLKKDWDIDRLYEQVLDINDYYHRATGYGEDYNFDQIRVEKLEYGIVRKAFFLHMMSIASMWAAILSIFFALYSAWEQLGCIRKDYKRTVKGKALLNKAYALRNYLKEYSLAKYRSAEELDLWEYYLIYAVALDVNVRIEDEVIENYIKTVV